MYSPVKAVGRWLTQQLLSLAMKPQLPSPDRQDSFVLAHDCRCAPDQVYIDNPLMIADYHNTYGINYAIPDTEEFIENIGRMMDDKMVVKLDQEVSFEEQDFVDPHMMFSDEGKQ